MNTRHNNYGQPAWITQPLSGYDIAGILAGESDNRTRRDNHEPLDSGCYMPAVEYETARRIMDRYGDDVLDYLQRVKGCNMPCPDMRRYSWAQLPCFFLSRAILAFAEQHKQFADWENEDPIDLSK